MDSSENQKVPGFGPSELARHLRTALELPTRASGIVRETSEAILVVASHMSASDLVSCLWTTAFLKDVSPDVLKLVSAIVEHLPGKAPEMNAENIGDCLLALALLKDEAPQVLEILTAIMEQIPAKADDMEALQASQCLYAAHELQAVAPDLLKIASSHYPRCKVDSKADHLSNQLRALAEAQDVDVEFPEEFKTHILTTVIAQLPGEVADMTAAQLANGLWAVCELRCFEDQEILTIVPSLVAEIPKKATDMDASDLCCCLNGVAALKDEAPEVLKIVPVVVAQIPGARWVSGNQFSFFLVWGVRGCFILLTKDIPTYPQNSVHIGLDDREVSMTY